MKTRIEIFEIADPEHVVSDGVWNGKLSTAEIRRETQSMMRYLDRRKYAYRVVYVDQNK